MRPIKLYFAAAWSGGGPTEVNLIEAGVKNKLVSYVYPSQFDGWIENLPQLQEGAIILDSGAFSVWNKGKTIDLDAYIAYAHQALDRISKFPNQQMYIVNLDVIPGVAGRTHSLNRNRKQENLDLIEYAARQGYKNMKIMLQNGIKPIHVFHQGEHWRWLDRMLHHIDYIGISPANDLDSSARVSWMETVFTYLHKQGMQEVKTHGFAVTNRKVLLRFPWESCDAASWRLAAGMGNIYIPQGGFSNPNYAKPCHVCNVSERKTMKNTKKLPFHLLKALKEEGYIYNELQTWQCRTRINIRYFLGLEKWLNNEKKGIQFSPRTHLGLQEDNQ
jgi:hypothetical protein